MEKMPSSAIYSPASDFLHEPLERAINLQDFLQSQTALIDTGLQHRNLIEPTMDSPILTNKQQLKLNASFTPNSSFKRKPDLEFKINGGQRIYDFPKRKVRLTEQPLDLSISKAHVTPHKSRNFADNQLQKFEAQHIPMVQIFVYSPERSFSEELSTNHSVNKTKSEERSKHASKRSLGIKSELIAKRNAKLKKETLTEPGAIINGTIKTEPLDVEYLTCTPMLPILDAIGGHNFRPELVQPPPLTDNEFRIEIGPNGTTVSKVAFDAIRWDSVSISTRALIALVFDRQTLATHTLSGKPSPAFRGRERPPKGQLDPLKVADVVHCVEQRINCTRRDIRSAITMKCADTAKTFKKNRNVLDKEL